MTLKLLTSAMVIATFLGAVVFVLVYLRRNWHSSAVGLNLMAFGVVIAIESGLAVSTLIWGTQWANRDIIRVASWALISATMWWRVVLLFTTRPPRAAPREDDRGPD